MKKGMVFIVVILAVLFSWNGLKAADSPAPAAEQPKYTVGDYWVFTKDQGEKAQDDNAEAADIRVTFVSQEGDVYNFLKNGSVPFKKDKFLTPITGKSKGYPGPILQFPLKVDKHWSYDFMSVRHEAPWPMTAKYSVEAYEQITVPAGTFWAYRVEVAIVFNVKNSFNTYTTKIYWYAPAAKNIIKGSGMILKEYKVQ
ncbi:MAG: hypothetical protein ACLPN1_16585 [Dissulfurispiraceae bacterium]